MEQINKVRISTNNKQFTILINNNGASEFRYQLYGTDYNEILFQTNYKDNLVSWLNNNIEYER